jgi:hypothetical protein
VRSIPNPSCCSAVTEELINWIDLLLPSARPSYQSQSPQNQREGRGLGNRIYRADSGTIEILVIRRCKIDIGVGSMKLEKPITLPASDGAAILGEQAPTPVASSLIQYAECCATQKIECYRQTSLTYAKKINDRVDHRLGKMKAINLVCTARHQKRSICSWSICHLRIGKRRGDVINVRTVVQSERVSRISYIDGIGPLSKTALNVVTCRRRPMGPAGRVYRYCLSGRNKYNADNRR